jgi:hypothetical protein
VDLLRGIYLDKTSLKRRHELAARVVRQYDRNNTYQYIIAREEVHLAWLRDALHAEGVEVPPSAGADPSIPSAETEAIGADVEAQSAFIERWTAPVRSVTHARHRLMLDLMIGESREQWRFLVHAAGGRTDLLGRRTTTSPAAGNVLGERWVR